MQQSAGGLQQTITEQSIKQLLAQPNNNYGIGIIFKKFAVLGACQQQEMVTKVVNYMTAELNELLEMRALREDNIQNNQKYQYFLRVLKRIAYGCPLIEISDRFFKLFMQYVTKQPASQTIQVAVEPDEISDFFKQENVLPLPIGLSENGSDVQRKESSLQLANVVDEFDKTEVNIEELLHRLFMQNARVYRHELLLVPWFPRYLQLFTESQEALGMSRTDDSLPPTQNFGGVFLALWGRGFLVD
ncbi:hypothetical protein FGO68_gene15403 [Halteria grandinella]|uniref:Uncharacterized protein n=1 Tax=Halteria grandinella TaxID=5974 RepID=A0A8J8NCZ7_HALGN|nr:hypothetical protein FGO68_gene15403 [Halteria grandinella]